MNLNTVSTITIPRQGQSSLDPSDQPHVPRYKSLAQIIFIIVNLSLSNFYFGYCLVYISTIEFKEIVRIFDIPISPQTAKGIIIGCIPIGAGIGALLGRKLIHLFSRRKLVLLVNLIALIAGGIIFVNNMISFILMRYIQGICVGIYTSIIPLYINQLCPAQILSSSAPFTQIFCSIGTTVTYLFYYILNASIEGQNKQDLIWYLILGFPIIPLVIQSVMLLFVFPYQTPKYYLLHNDQDKARELIVILYKPEFVEIVFKEKFEDLQSLKKKQTGAIKIQSNTQQTQQQVLQNTTIPKKLQSKNHSKAQLPQPYTPKFAIFAAIHLMILRQFSGINAVVAYGGDIISQSSQNLRDSVPIILNIEIMLGAFVAICILHKVGKKTLLQAGTIILALSLVFITIGFFIIDTSKSQSFVLILLGLIIFTFTFGLTYGAIIWTYVSQIVEPSYDILATMITWIFASIVIVLFPILKKEVLNGNPSLLFLFFGVWMLVSFFVNHKVLIETKDKQQLQIRQEYMNMKLTRDCSFSKKGKENKFIPEIHQFDISKMDIILPELKRKQNKQYGNPVK